MGDDDDIREAVRRGDVEAAFELVMARYERSMFTRSVAVLRDDSLAEDAVQTAVMKVMSKVESADGLDDVVNLRAWLSTVAHNAALDLLKRNNRQKHRVARLRQYGTDDEVVTMPPTSGDIARGNAALDHCLGELEPSTRAAFLRRELDEASWDEIARELGLAVDAVRMRVKRAKQGLKRCLERQDVES